MSLAFSSKDGGIYRYLPRVGVSQEGRPGPTYAVVPGGPVVFESKLTHWLGSRGRTDVHS